MKGTKTMKKMMMVAAATVAAWCSWGAESISVDEVANHYPWDGKVDCVYTVSGLANGYLYDGAFELSVKKNGETIRRVITNALGKVAGTYTNTFDCTALFGAGCYPNGGIKVALVKKMDGVQLWKGGPYFATCNVGATKPEEYGYYFWWGDTVGYKRNAMESGWISVKDGTAHEFLDNSTACPTLGKDLSQLQSEGWCSKTSNNLAIEHDAARAYHVTSWYMPQTEFLQKLTNTTYCTPTWTANWNGTGVAGLVVTGATTGYTDKSIFLPAAGSGVDSDLRSPGSKGRYRSSESDMTNINGAMYMWFGSDELGVSGGGGRRGGYSVRPIRWSAP